MAGDRSLEVGPDVRSSRNTKPTQQLAPERVTAWPAGGADVAHSQVVKSEQSPCHGMASASAMVCCRQPTMMRGEVRGRAL